MSDTRFDVYFSGQLAPGVDAEQAASQLARTFKTQPERLAALFTGNPALVKRNLSRAEAVRYRQALSQAGMTSIFREHGAPAPLREHGVPAPVPAQPALTLAPAGSDVLTPEERSRVAPVEVDISGLSLAPAGTELLRPEERRELPAPEIDTSALQILPTSS